MGRSSFVRCAGLIASSVLHGGTPMFTHTRVHLVAPRVGQRHRLAWLTTATMVLSVQFLGGSDAPSPAPDPPTRQPAGESYQFSEQFGAAAGLTRFDYDVPEGAPADQPSRFRASTSRGQLLGQITWREFAALPAEVAVEARPRTGPGQRAIIKVLDPDASTGAFSVTIRMEGLGEAIFSVTRSAAPMQSTTIDDCAIAADSAVYTLSREVREAQDAALRARQPFSRPVQFATGLLRYVELAVVQSCPTLMKERPCEMASP